MSALKKVSRDEIGVQKFVVQEQQEVVLPELEFEFIEVEVDHDTIDQQQQAQLSQQQDEDEYEFPLFGGDARGRNDEKTTTKKISIREPSEERIIQSRPNSYYFAKYTQLERKQFEEIAINGVDIIKDMSKAAAPVPDTMPWRVMDLVKHNDKIEQEKAVMARKKSTQRPGKKKRINIIASRERKQDRLKQLKLVEKEKKKKLMKKIHHKRGGKKNKKKAAGQAAVPGSGSGSGSTKKYRTE